MEEKRGFVSIDNKVVYGDKCIHQILGDHIDIQWDKNTGEMSINSSTHSQFHHESSQNLEIFKYVPLRHSQNCLLFKKQAQGNSNRKMRPCTVILVQDAFNGKILATKRPVNISFGGLWVLPGGHLQKGETVVEGGLRQCSEEVALNKDEASVDIPSIMAWESVFIVDKAVKATALALFFKATTKHFQVKGQEGEVQCWEWRDWQKKSFQEGGWAEGHLTYLNYIFDLNIEKKSMDKQQNKKQEN